MKKILNEWRRFVTENLEDDREVASILLQAIETGNREVPEMQSRLRLQKQRAKRILKAVLSDDFLDGGVFETDTIYKHDLPLHFMVVTKGESGWKYFESSEEFRKRAQLVLDILEANEYEIPTRIALDFRSTTGPRSSNDDHSGGPGDAGLALPSDAFDKEERADLDKHIMKWVALQRAIWSGDKNKYATAAKDTVDTVQYFISLYRKYMPLDSKYVEALYDLKLRLINKEPPQKAKAPDLMKLARQKIKEIQKQIEVKNNEKKNYLRTDRKKVKEIEQEIATLQSDLSRAKREKDKIFRSMRGR